MPYLITLKHLHMTGVNVSRVDVHDPIIWKASFGQHCASHFAGTVRISGGQNYYAQTRSMKRFLVLNLTGLH